MDQSDELYLLHAAKAGNEVALERLLQMHNGYIQIIARRFAGSGPQREENIEDLAQEARLAFCEAVKSFQLGRTAREFGALAQLAITRHCINVAPNYGPLVIRKWRGRSEESQENAVVTTVPVESLETEQAEGGAINPFTEEFFNNLFLQKCIDHLTPLQRQIIMRSYGLGGNAEMQPLEIANEMDMKPSNVRYHRDRAILDLREMIGRETGALCLAA